QVDHDVEALGDIPLRLGHGLMGGTSWAEAVAVLGERRVPTLLQNLQHGLLDQSVDDTGDAEFPDPAVRFGYLDPFDRLRLVGPPPAMGIVCLANAHEGSSWRRRWSPHQCLEPLYFLERVATRARGSLARTPPPSSASLQPGFRALPPP